VAVVEEVPSLLIKGNQTFSYECRQWWTSVPGEAIVGALNTVAVMGSRESLSHVVPAMLL
jgi:hypothetical protein